MATAKLFYEDPFLKTFSARVRSCEKAETGFAVSLDRTAFYPEGGGQPADHGFLNDAAVVDVHEKGGVILHNVDKSLEIGETVTGIIDWPRRFDHMQQHSGEHILSGILCRNYHCDNVGFHMGADTVTIDYNADISWEQALKAEQEANNIIAADKPVEITYPSQEELKAINYRSKKELTGQVRIVTFPGADCCACCGTHVFRAGQVELVKVLSVQKFRGGVRMEIVCGSRAVNLFSTVYNQSRAVAQMLSVKISATADAVNLTLKDLAMAKQRMSELEDQVFAAAAEKYAGHGDVLLLENSMRPDAVRKLADAVAKRCGGLCAVFAGSDGDQYNYALIRADGGDLRDLVKNLNASLDGRGGGKCGFAQGSVQTSHEKIKSFFEKRC